MSSSGGLAVEEIRLGGMINLAEDCSQVAKKVEKGGELHDHSMKSSPSNNLSTDDSSNSKEEDALESAKAEMGEVREENERLKMMLKRIEEDYQSLKFRFFGILHQETSKKSTDSTASHETEEPELVSLSLGRSPTDPIKKVENSGNSSKTKPDEDLKASLTLGLDVSNFAISNPSPENSLEEPKEDEAGEARSSTKIPKRNSDDEVAQQSQVKRARVCVRARCDTPTMSDGCQWRKYGQKVAKGNPCPRAYYRCTVAPSCPVRKQVQRCAEDLSILITTYEGTHNHPLPVSATAMASTTSAAASMLLSGSSASQPGLGSHITATSATELSGLSFSPYNNFGSKQLYFPNPSSTMFPTITLDLTATPPSSSSTTINRFSSTFPLPSRFPSTSMGFSSTASNTIPTAWGGGSYSPVLPAYTPQQLYRPHNMENNHQSASQQVLAETLTKAIASDPSFRTVVATALSSMIGGGSANTNGGNQQVTGGGEIYGQNLKHGEATKQAISSGTPMHQSGKGCAPSFFNGLSSASSHSGSLLQPAFPFSMFDSASASTHDKE